MRAIKNDSHSYLDREVQSPLIIDELKIKLGNQTLVQHVALEVQPKSIHCLVGQSGSGKTLTSLAAVGLLPRGAEVTGSLRLATATNDLLTLDQKGWSEVRGSLIGYVGQNALGCLHPAFRIGTQLVEAIQRHQSISKRAARALALEELRAVDLPEVERVASSYPAQLSGGMCQRVAIAIALCNRPEILIADEPTTALDDQTQSRILNLLRSRVDDTDLSVLLITHDHAVVNEMADEVTEISAGISSRSRPRAVATPTCQNRASEAHAAKPPADHEVAVLEIRNVGKTYAGGRRFQPAPTTVLRDVSISVTQGTTIGLVGPSGSGKTTLAQIVAGVLAPTEGSVHIAGRPISGPDKVGRVEKAGLVQYVFQDPFGSLNPRRPAVTQVVEPLVAAGCAPDEAMQRARHLLSQVGLTGAQSERKPTALSGGQCQRVGIARALIRQPCVVVLDEPVSALDWGIRSEILDILGDLQAAAGVLYLLISHDRSLVEAQSESVYEVVEGTVRPASVDAASCQPELSFALPI